MSREVKFTEITEDNFEEVTTRNERNTLEFYSPCSKCGHPLTKGVHDVVEVHEDFISYGFFDTIRRCKIRGCDCEVRIGHFKPPGIIENMK